VREDQIRRYARHVLLPDVGGVGQRRLLESAAVVDEAAGAGAVALVYLAAAGVGTLVVRDAGTVRPEDVGFLYETADVGRARVDALRARVAALNPDVQVVTEGAGRPLAVGPAHGTIEELLAGTAAAGDWVREVART
jgi:molybdopterin-synthase adenylyltransferase